MKRKKMKWVMMMIVDRSHKNKYYSKMLQIPLDKF